MGVCIFDGAEWLTRLIGDLGDKYGAEYRVEGSEKEASECRNREARGGKKILGPKSLA